MHHCKSHILICTHFADLLSSETLSPSLVIMCFSVVSFYTITKFQLILKKDKKQKRNYQVAWLLHVLPYDLTSPVVCPSRPAPPGKIVIKMDRWLKQNHN